MPHIPSTRSLGGVITKHCLQARCLASFRSHPQAPQSGQKELPAFVVWIRSDPTRVSGTAVDGSAARAIRSVRHRETICGSRQGS